MDSNDDLSWVKDSTDQELAVKTASGNSLCFDELIFRHEKQLHKYLQSRVKNQEDTKELVQETFIKAYANIDRFDPGQKFSTWLYTIATRLMLSFYRDKKNKNSNLELEDNITIPEGGESEYEDLGNFWELARNLPPVEYKVLSLRIKENRTLKEIAAVIKKNPERVRIILHKAKRTLAREFNPQSKDK